MCTQCWETGNTRNNCNNEPWYNLCKSEGHEPGDPRCKSNKPQENIIAFNGENNVLSNFFLCDLSIFGIQHKSAKHAFQYKKALRLGDQESTKQIQQSKTAFSTKRIGDKIKTYDQRNESSQSLMTDIIENKCAQV